MGRLLFRFDRDCRRSDVTRRAQKLKEIMYFSLEKRIKIIEWGLDILIPMFIMSLFMRVEFVSDRL
jgi:hypothetical protein